MVTRIHEHAKPRLFLKENREAKGVSAIQMARRLGIERESVYRIEREPWRLNASKLAAYAHTLGLEPPDLWRMPPPPNAPPSLDEMVRHVSPEVRDMVVDVVRRMVATGRR